MQIQHIPRILQSTPVSVKKSLVMYLRIALCVCAFVRLWFHPYIIHHLRDVVSWMTLECSLAKALPEAGGLAAVVRSFLKPSAGIDESNCRKSVEVRLDLKVGGRSVVVAQTSSAAGRPGCWWRAPSAPTFDPSSLTAARHDTFSRRPSSVSRSLHDRFHRNKSLVSPASDPSAAGVPVAFNYSHHID